uniref:Uncharacterized protein n=1 Tax=Sinocyclocheilus rhinocerous TaxID=307959 RepID=A0A673KZ65_9TELE
MNSSRHLLPTSEPLKTQWITFVFEENAPPIYINASMFARISRDPPSPTEEVSIRFFNESLQFAFPNNVLIKKGYLVNALHIAEEKQTPLIKVLSVTGGNLLLEIWEGWNEFLRDCFRGHKQTSALLQYVCSGCFGTLINSGVRAEDPVGVHPYRTWCYQTAHPDSLKCPTHAAVEAGHLLILKLFVSRSIANLACCDPGGRNLLQIAIRHRRREFVTYLASTLYITVNFPGCSLPMHIYLQIKTWIRRLGDLVHVDGFPMQKKSSNPRGRAMRGCIEVKESSRGFPVTSCFVGPSCVCHHPAAPPSQSASVVLPQLHPPQTIKSARREQNITRNRACGRKNPKEILPAENSNGSMEAWRSKVPLPHAFPDIRHRHFLINRSSKSDKIPDVPQETFKLLNGRTLRENAIYCLAIARLVIVINNYNVKSFLKPCRIKLIKCFSFCVSYA